MSSLQPPPPPPSPTVEHLGFHIPRRLAVLTGTLPDFTTVSNFHMDILRRYGELDRARSIVEIGCGVGRDAIAIARMDGEPRHYLGIDIIEESIVWATKNIAPRHPTFEFLYINPGDKPRERMQERQIPREDASQDLIFLFSVFTHMFPTDLRHYLSEFHRMLRPGGRVVTTMFVVSDALLAHIKSIGGGGMRALTFEHEIEQGFYHNDPEMVPGSTAYSREWIARAAQEADLQLTDLAKGTWARDGVSDVHGQDVVVLRKT